MVVSIQTVVFWFVTLCSLVGAFKEYHSNVIIILMPLFDVESVTIIIMGLQSC